MKPLGPNVALAIDGGGMRGVMVTRALAMVEKAEHLSFGQVARLFAGTSGGSIIAAGLSVGLTAARMHELFTALSDDVFRRTWRSAFWLLTPYRYSNQPLINILKTVLGDMTMGDLWRGSPRKDLIIVVHDIVENRARFVTPWKAQYQDWHIWEAVVASSTVPTYFPVFKGRYVDGAVGGYGNSAFVAAYEIAYNLEDWLPEETTLISIGTGSTEIRLKEGEASRFLPWNWLAPTLDAMTSNMARLQLELTHQLYAGLDFRRFQIELPEPIASDDTDSVDKLTVYGEKLGQMILNDEWEEEPPPAERIVLG